MEIAWIAVLWACAVWLVNPIGDFPLNDDWAMGGTVKELIEHGTYRPSGWAAMPMVTQVLWGALFCIPAGFSYTALRFSTLALSSAAVLGIYTLVRSLGASRFLRLTCAFTLCFNPVFFALSNTFMTDVPFLAFLVWSLVFLVRFFRDVSAMDLVLATVLATAATLCRQLGLCVGLAFAVVWIWRYGFSRRNIAVALLPAVTGALALYLLQFWLSRSGELPLNFSEKSDKLVSLLKNPLRAPVSTAYYGWSMLMYLGLFLLPVTAPVLLSRQYLQHLKRNARLHKYAVLAFLLASGIRMAVMPALMPVHNNVIIPQGIGPAMLHDSTVRNLPNLPALPAAFWVMVTILSLAGAALLVSLMVGILVNAVRQWRKRDRGEPGNTVLFFFLSALIYLSPLFLIGFFDRYLLPVVCFACSILALLGTGLSGEQPRWAQRGSACLVAGFALFSVAATRDYLEWNRVRWQVLDRLITQDKISADRIDGGFEFNGLYKFHTFTYTNWWKVDDTYALSFAPEKGFRLLQRHEYRNWLPPRTGQILVLKKESSAATTEGNAIDHSQAQP